MNKTIVAIFVTAVFAVALSGCCTSLMCQAEKAASAELACDGNVKVTNLSYKTPGAAEGRERTLMVDGCGKQVKVACEPTNLEKRVKHYREDVVKPQNRLDLKWKCQTESSLAQK